MDNSIDTFFKNREKTKKAVPIYSTSKGGWIWVKYGPKAVARSRADLMSRRPGEAQCVIGSEHVAPHPAIHLIQRKNENQATCDKVARMVRRMKIG